VQSTVRLFVSVERKLDYVCTYCRLTIEKEHHIVESRKICAASARGKEQQQQQSNPYSTQTSASCPKFFVVQSQDVSNTFKEQTACDAARFGLFLSLPVVQFFTDRILIFVSCSSPTFSLICPCCTMPDEHVLDGARLFRLYDANAVRVAASSRPCKYNTAACVLNTR
jgi:hypothetical protein